MPEKNRSAWCACNGTARVWSRALRVGDTFGVGNLSPKGAQFQMRRTERDDKSEMFRGSRNQECQDIRAAWRLRESGRWRFAATAAMVAVVGMEMAFVYSSYE